MNTRLLPLLLSLILLLPLLPSTGFAQEKPVFSINGSDTISILDVKMGEETAVTIEGSHLMDVFGFELRVAYDPQKVRFLSGTTSWSGMTVPPIDRSGEVIFAHTLIGQTPGRNGEAQLATLRFEALVPGDTSISLVRVKLVNSKIESELVEPGLELRLSVAPEVEQPQISFTDINGHWASANILRAAQLGWVNGYPDGTFRPQETVTRVQFTTMLSRALMLTGGSGQGLEFIDEDQIPAYAQTHVAQAVAAGIVQGFEDQSFRPHKRISRSEMAVMIMRAMKQPLPEEAGIALNYSDAELIQPWARPAVAAATERGLIKGRGNNLFVPQGETTRAEAVTLILRMLGEEGVS
ncbi:S-layer homology domain-containing protein [Paenibacillus daejeonensis]|uniref:S-layer homology domain-containing protein n=1 Tax=Paenibacillus daejeonensis TaxID=135193 RepID=UPI000381ED1C|nr:S-layer homology domain-containing protein [Paenibacillus daejeonensis]